MALRLKYMLESEDTGSKNPSEDQESEDSKGLAIRILQLRQRELRMELADIESRVAIARNNDSDEGSLSALEESQKRLQQSLVQAEAEVEQLTAIKEDSSSSVTSIIGNLMDRVADWTTDGGNNTAPYRGAIGYAPMLDSKDDINDSLLPYTSPYDLLKEIIDEQLNAKVIGCVLENTSLLKGTTAIGGAVVLQRKTPTKRVTLAGEEVEYNDYEEDLGNEILGGETMIVECDTDEAIGVALACGVSIKVESDIFERSTVIAEPASTKQGPASENIIDFLSMWKPSDPSFAFEVEGERPDASSPNPLSIPRTTTSLFDSIFDENKPKDSSLFPTDNPIKSLNQLDALSNEGKAKQLLEMSNFNGRLPRPRVVKNAESNPLDKLLLPLIDESVRRQYMIRDAEREGDTQLVEELKASESRYQKAREQAEMAKTIGDDAFSEQWESEAEFQASLRADVTQDEGAYSRFLDRDDWYERERRATAKRVKKSSFGNLLDGIE